MEGPFKGDRKKIRRLSEHPFYFFAWVVLLLFSFHTVEADEGRSGIDPVERDLKKATFAGGCFWCMEPPYEKLPGVLSVRAGYTGGKTKNPTYEEVSSGTTGHAEAVEIVFDPMIVSYRDLLEVFWRNIDPTTPNRQFADVGSQYRTAIFYHNEDQKKDAQASKEALEKSGKFDKPIVTEILPAMEFYPAEETHQDYYKKNPVRYKLYRFGSGRDAFLNQVWGEKKS